MAKQTVKINDEFETKYGKCRVIDYKGCEEVYVKFLNTDGVTKTNTSDLRRGFVKDYFYPTVEGIGYLGKGSYKSRINGKLTEEYRIWQAMLKRCYNKTIHKKEPSYSDCYVCKDWLNFQNFANWMNSVTYRKQGWQLDKDLLLFNNKVYSPEYCVFIPASINKCLVTNRSNPNVGVKKRGNKYLVYLSIHNKNTFFGSYLSLEEAKKVYKENKLKYLYELANEEDVPQFIIDKFESYLNLQQN